MNKVASCSYNWHKALEMLEQVQEAQAWRGERMEHREEEKRIEGRGQGKRREECVSACLGSSGGVHIASLDYSQDSTLSFPCNNISHLTLECPRELCVCLCVAIQEGETGNISAIQNIFLNIYLKKIRY